MKKLFLILLLLFTSLQATPKKFVVAFAQDTMANDFRVAQVRATQKAFKKYPLIKFIYSDAKANTALFLQQIDDFIDAKVDLLLVGAGNDTLTVPVIEKAMKKGIPVILIDRNVQTDNYTSYIHPDNAAMSRKAALYMAKKIHYKGRILMLKGIPHADVTKDRTKAFLKAMKKYPNIEIIERTGNFLRRDAITAFEDVLAREKPIDAIFSQSDSMLSGVRMVLKLKKIDPKSLLMVGIDYISETKNAIIQGTQDSTFIYQLCAKESVKTAIDILQGKKVPKEIIIPTRHIHKKNVHNYEPIF